MRRNFHLLNISQGNFFPFKFIMLIINKIAEIKILNTDMVTEEILHNFENKTSN